MEQIKYQLNRTIKRQFPYKRSVKNSFFIWQEINVLDLISNSFEKNVEARTARSIYIALTKISFKAYQSATFEAAYSQIAKEAQASRSTAKRYCKEFVKLGIVVKTQGHIANKWTLMSSSNKPTRPKNEKSEVTSEPTQGS